MKLDVLPGQLFTGLAVGAAAVILVPVILPLTSGLLKTVAKAAIKGSLLAYERGKVAMAEAQEMVEDITAEAKAEMSEEESAAPAPKRKRAPASRPRKKVTAANVAA